MDTTPYWTAGAKKCPALTAAYQLKRAGLKVALVERNRCMQGETGLALYGRGETDGRTR